MKAFLQSMTYWRAAIGLCATYALINCANTFIASTDSYSGEAWNNLSGFEKGRLYINCFISLASTVAAFLDKTVATMTTEPEQPPLKNENPS